MALDKVSLSNLALQMIGANRIASFSEDSREARAVSTIYDDARDEILCENAWTFAQRRVVLATVSLTLDATIYSRWDGITVAYAFPPDCLKIHYTSQYSANHKIEDIGGVKYILADTSGLGIKYTYQCDDPTLYFSKFTSAFATLLSYKLCFNLSESRNKASDMYSQYIDIDLPTACAADSMQGTPDEPAQSDWENGRLSGGTPFVIRPGQLSWGYPW